MAGARTCAGWRNAEGSTASPRPAGHGDAPALVSGEGDEAKKVSGIQWGATASPGFCWRPLSMPVDQPRPPSMASDGPPPQPVLAFGPSSAALTFSGPRYRQPAASCDCWLKEFSRRPVDQPSGAGDGPAVNPSLIAEGELFPGVFKPLPDAVPQCSPRSVPLSCVRFPTPNCRTACAMQVRGSSMKLCKGRRYKYRYLHLAFR
jgi:hypothetical protein